MDTIFQLPLFLLACFQTLIALLLALPRPIALPMSKLIKASQRNVPTNSVILTLALVLAGLLATCFLELIRGGDQARHNAADARQVVGTIDYLRAQVSGVLCAMNLAMLFLGRALASSVVAEDHAAKNLDAMSRQVKGVTAEYERVTKGPSRTSSGPEASGGSGNSSGSNIPTEAEALRKQVDKLIREKDEFQLSLEGANKAKATAEASVTAMKSQLKGFDQHFDRILEENKMLKRKLVGHGDATYSAEVTQQHTGKKDE